MKQPPHFYSTPEQNLFKTPIQEWINKNYLVDNELIYRKSALEQVIFMRDYFPRNLFSTWNNSKAGTFIISTHRSKSIELPVCQYETDLGVIITIRDNFHDFKVSVQSDYDIPFDFDILFERDVIISPTVMEGFPASLTFKSWQDDPREFTFEVGDSHQMMIFAFLLRRGWENLGNSFK